MADDEDGEDELESLWNPTKSHGSARPKKSLELVVAHGKESYVALEAKDKVAVFVVRSASNGFRYSFSYHAHFTTAVKEPSEDFLSIITDRAAIELYGKNLLPIALALDLRTCHTITEFNPAHHLPPTDKSAPFIERIEVILPRPPEKPQRVAKAEKTAEEA